MYQFIPLQRDYVYEISPKLIAPTDEGKDRKESEH